MGSALDQQPAANSRTYPTRPILRSAPLFSATGRVLIVRRGAPPTHGIYTLPGGGVELGETLEQAVMREVREETGLAIEPLVTRRLPPGDRTRLATARSSGISSFCRLRRADLAGEISLNAELAEAQLAVAGGTFRTENDRRTCRNRYRCRRADRRAIVIFATVSPSHVWATAHAAVML